MSTASTIVLITGANSGIGFATSVVIASASESYHVILTSRSIENGEKALAEARAIGHIKGKLSFCQMDVLDEDSITAAADYVKSTFGHLDVLINNAGILSTSSSLKAELSENLLTNTLGPMLVTESFRPLLLKSQNPRVLFLSSELGSMGLASNPEYFHYNATYTAYRASKVALNMLVLQESKKWGEKGIKIWSVCPGLVKSNLRGKDEESVNAGGYASDPALSGQLILSIIEGHRDSDVGRFVHRDGVYPW